MIKRKKILLFLLTLNLLSLTACIPDVKFDILKKITRALVLLFAREKLAKAKHLKGTLAVITLVSKRVTLKRSLALAK